MSLTSFLSIPQVRARLQRDWPVPSPRPQSSKWPLLAPLLSARPQLIGNAFDYVFRFHLRRLNSLAEEREEWVAESALLRLSDQFQEAGQHICQKARTRYGRFLEGEPLHDDLLVSALQLAQLDAVFRAGYLPPSSEFLVFPEDIADLRQLVTVCDWSQWCAEETCSLNPTFGIASCLVGGADADFRLDNTLYDIKTTKRHTVASSYYHQLIGYSLLNFLDLDSETPIEQISVYYSRFAQTVTWAAPRWHENEHEPFVKWFLRATEKVFKHGVNIDKLLTIAGDRCSAKKPKPR